MRHLRIFLSLTLIFAVISCSDINEAYTNGYSDNPNDPTDAPLSNLFVASQAATIEFMEGHPARLASMWVQQSTGESRQYSGYYNYNISGRDLSFGNAWQTAYTGILSNIKLVQEKAAEGGGSQANIVAVSKIMEAITIGTLTGLWGDIPYSEALNLEEFKNPSLDSQADVYSAAQDLLDDAISTLQNDPRDLPEGVDIFSYKGDVEKWVKAAYTFKARFYMETGEPDKAITAAQNGIQAKDGSDDLKFLHGTTYQGNMNLWYSFMVFDRNGMLGATDNHAYPMMANRQNSKTDESGRMDFYYSDSGTSLNTNEDGVFAQSADYLFLGAAETYLILAEANAVKNTTQGDNAAISYLNDAREYNQNRFTGSTYDPLSLADFSTGGDYDNTTLLQEIYDEEYLSLSFQLEAFTFCRRIDYQITGLAPVPGQSNFPERFLYPDSEQNANPNVPKQTNADLFNPTPINQ